MTTLNYSLSVLEFFPLLESICEQAQSPGGMEIIRALRPSDNPDVISRNHGLYRDMILIRNKPLELPSLRTEPITDILRQVSPQGAVLDGAELLLCRELLDTTGDVKDFTQQKECLQYEHLQRLATGLEPCFGLRESLARSIDRDGSVMDSASEKLRMLRRQTAALEQKIQRRLEQMLKSGDCDTALQEHFVTLRNGRYVVPIKRESKSAVPGIVHDLSHSGQTLFVEPSETLGMGNDLAAARVEERDEIIRILAELSARVRENLPYFRENQRILDEMDAAAAVARWAGWNNCELPVFGKTMKIQSARHPLLQMQFRKQSPEKQVVPLNLNVPSHVKTIAITGSNTGGKTVILKTLGLLSLIAQSGLPVPAGPDSTFTIFSSIVADIGDGQSIQENLSTFSARIKNISDMLAICRRGRSLVLLDELGGGTDPVEGGAIACAVFEKLASLNTLTVATTHLAMVKNYVHSRRDMLNAAVRFDVNTLKPEYILETGRPGASHALLIAERLGLPKDVINAARRMLSEDQIKLEDMLARMEADQRKIAVHASKIANTESDISAKRDALKAELEELRTQRRQMLMDAHRQSQALVNNTRREMENLVRGIREAAKNTSNGKKTQETPELDPANIRKALEDKEKRIESGLKMHGEKSLKPLDKSSLRTGLRVWVEKMRSHGIVESIFAGGSKVSVSINGLEITMNASELEENRDGHDKEEKKTVVKMIHPVATGKVSSEINVIGMTVEEAQEALTAFIDNGILGRMPELRIVHGFGTGRLRRGIHAWLTANPSVSSFHVGRDGKDPGGGGCTIVYLK